MKKIAIIPFFLLSFTISAQELSGLDIGYKIGVNRFSHAYSMVNSDSSFETRSDAFTNSNFYVNYINWQESFLANVNLEGVIYLALQKTILKLKPGPLKSVPYGYDKLLKENPHITVPVNGSEESVHPTTGLGDYQWVNADFAWGNKIKLGVNFAWGFLGANGENNGISLGIAPPIKSWKVQTVNIGYLQYGLTGHYILDDENSNMLLSAHLSKTRTITKRFDKRTGYALEVEFKYFFLEDGSTVRPYITGYLDYRRMKKGTAEIVDSSVGLSNEAIPALNVNAIGIKVGMLLGLGI